MDTTEYQATAQHFLAEVLDTIESQATDGKFAAPSSKNGGTIEEINHFEVVASRSGIYNITNIFSAKIIYKKLNFLAL